jgi:hypothetical protein
MTDHTLARADEVLTELVELVETARNVPMSSSCMIPREKTLDLLDALREVLPPEMVEARRIVADRERLVAETAARVEAERTAATDEAQRLIADATLSAQKLIDDGQAEQAELVSSSSVHRAAAADAEHLRAEADDYARATREQAQAVATQLVAEARRKAERLGAQAHGYAERTLTDLSDTLHRLAATADNGRATLQSTEQDADFSPPADLG